jgi:cholesterol oxidase
MSGFKLVKDDPGFDVWSDTSTLYVKLLTGHVDADTEAAGTAEVAAAGIINIYLKDFAKQMTTFRTHGGSVGQQAGAMAKFGKLFLGDLWDVYGGRATEAASTD